VPLKIKIFMWFLHRNGILTKDNLSKCNWNDRNKCVFCDHEELINHLSFECPFPRLVWRVIHFTFNIAPPINCANLFGGVDKDTKARIRVGTCL
jgi:hypothetical protein